MHPLIRPERLRPGDTVAVVSLSWGGAGDPDLLWRYKQGKKRLEEDFSLRVREMPNALRGSEFLYAHPEKRAEDLMAAFADKDIRGIFTMIGGDDSLRLLPYIDFSVIRDNPKVFIGYSDTTVAHFMCLKAGLSSFYGVSVLAELAENVSMFDYTKEQVFKTLFASAPAGPIPPSPGWTSEYLPWEEKNKDIRRKLAPNSGYEVLQGKVRVQGRLIGGCIDVLDMLNGTALWPGPEAFDDAVLFLETSEDMPEPKYIEGWLRNYAAQGILSRLRGIVWGKPYHHRYYEAYRQTIRKVLCLEQGLNELPVLYNLNFGHTEPMMCLPYGALTEIDCENAAFSILEPGVR